MVELNEEARSYLTSDEGVMAMNSQYGSSSVASTVSAVEYGVPLVIDALKHRAEDSAEIVNLLNLVRSLDTSQLGTPAMWERTSHRSDLGPDLLDAIFRDSLGNAGRAVAVRRLAERSRVGEASADGILGSAAWMVLAVIVNRYSRSLDRQTLLRVTSEEREALTEQGWDPWIRSVEWARPAVTGNDTVFTGARPDIRPKSTPTADPATASADNAGRYPPPAGRGNRREPGSAPISSPEQLGGRGPDRRDPYQDAGTGVPAGYAPPQRPPGLDGPAGYSAPLGAGYGEPRQGSRHRPMAQPQSMPPRHTRPRMPPPEPEPKRWPIAVAVAALLLLAGGAWWQLGGGGDGVDSGDLVAITGDSSDADDTNSTDGGSGTTAEETSTDETSGTTVVDAAYTGMITMEIPMKDIFTFDTTNAAGNVRITIDTNTGEACAFVGTTNVSAPYNAHIHLGGYPERGPVVVDFAPMSDGTEQCVANDLNDINDVLADPTEFYAEMHDPGGEYTIRGQLSEATLVEDLRDPATISDPDDNGGAAFDTDPAQMGAMVRFQGASLLAQGAVADQTILDALIGSLESSGVAVVNELRVEAGAPPPSGKFVATEGLTFPVGGDQLQGDNSAVLETMAAVILANPGWKLTVVGHTDDTGDRASNLELSRRRAQTVRAALEELGVSKDVLKVAGFGPDQPVAENDTPTGRQRNRRIEFIIDPT